MNTRDYLLVYWRQRWLILGVAVVAVAAALVITAQKPTVSGVSQSFAVNRINKETTPDYQYDGYYSLQAADIFSQTVVSWFSTPSVLQEMYTAAAIDPEITSINSLPSRFRVKRYSAQNIVVRFSERTPERAAQVSKAVRQVMETKAERLNQTAEGKSLFEVVGSGPVIAPVRPNMLMIGIAAGILGLAAGLFIAAARYFLREETDAHRN